MSVPAMVQQHVMSVPGMSWRGKGWQGLIPHSLSHAVPAPAQSARVWVSCVRAGEVRGGEREGGREEREREKRVGAEAVREDGT
eukprot:2860884-Rhodomonas_salina.4